MRDKKCEEQKRGTPAWMTTFGDMNSLLLTFFVAIISTIEIEGRELHLILSAFEGTFGEMTGGNTISAGELAEMGKIIETLPSHEIGYYMAKSMKDISEVLEPEISLKKVRLEEEKDGYKISLAADLFFEPGSAEINYDEGLEILKKLADKLRPIQNIGFKIEVIGHTDDQAIPIDASKKKQFSSKWELSAARACTVVKYFEKQGINPIIMTALGRADQNPLQSNETPEGRAYNRRIDIFISYEGTN